MALLLVAGTTAFAAQDVAIKFNHKLGGSQFAKFEEATAPSGDYMFLVSHLRYYISGIYIIHDGGHKTWVQDVYLLVDPANEDTYPLGSYDIINVEGIEFSVGVDQVRNHLDPSTYPPGHALGYQNPSMHWGWAAGYRFCTFEGKAGVQSAASGAVFQIHSVGDELYKTTTLAVGANNNNGVLEIPIVADYSKLLMSLDVSWGTITHGNYGEAITMMDNFRDHTFSAGVVASVEEVATQPIVAYPNPACGQVNVATGGLGNVTIEIYDVTGRRVITRQTSEEAVTIPTTGLDAGSYYLHMRKEGKLLGSQTITVVN